MRTRFLITLVLIVLAILVILFWLRPTKQVTVPEPMQKAFQPTNSPATPTIANEVSPNHPAIAQSVVPQLVSSNLATTSEERRAKVIEKYNEEHNAAIEFYGQIIDQNSNVVPDVKISIEIQQASLTPSATSAVFNGNVIRLDKETGADGRFEINGEKGDSVQFNSIQKKGYQLSPNASRNYGIISGSFNNPVVIKMWKEGTKESLVSGSYVFGIDSGKTYTLNLITGKKIEGQAEGDLLVSITRPPDAKPRDKFAWSFSIEAIGGGFADPDPSDEFMYIAPESGYQPKIEMQFDPNDPNWIGVINKQFFFRSRNSQVYGSVQVEVDPIYNVHSAIQVSYTLNPNGSRNLQP